MVARNKGPSIHDSHDSAAVEVDETINELKKYGEYMTAVCTFLRQGIGLEERPLEEQEAHRISLRCIRISREEFRPLGQGNRSQWRVMVCEPGLKSFVITTITLKDLDW